MKHFYQVLWNTLLANVTTSFLWFALVFWVYLETKSVLATGILGGTYMLLIALCGIWFGTIVDHHKKKRVMIMSSIITFLAFSLSGLLYVMLPHEQILNIGGPLFWLFTIVVLAGCVVENLRNIALSTTVSILVDKDKHANANGLVGTVQGVGFIVTSVLSGIAIGQLGMGWTLTIAIVLTGLSLLHLIVAVQIPEKDIVHDPELGNKKIDIKGSLAAIHAVPGLLALIFFSTFNNLVGGVYMALMDPYGLTLFSVEMWGIVFGVAGTGFVIGGLLVAKFGLGKNPLRTLLLMVSGMGLLGALFTIREWWLLYAFGIWVYMCMVPPVEAAEQTIVQRVVPLKRQGRVFGFAQAIEAAAAPITAFIIAPIAQYGIIPYMQTDAGKDRFGWLVGQGEARGIALVFLVSGVIMTVTALLALRSRSYRTLSKHYETA